MVVFGGVRPEGAWAQDIAAGMRRARLDGDRCGDAAEIFCSAATQPVADEDVLSYGVELGFRPTPSLELAVALGFASTGTVSGYFDGGNTGTGDSDAELLVGMNVAVRYRWVASTTFGPFEAINERGELRTTMTSTEAAFTYLFASVGAGLRF